MLVHKGTCIFKLLPFGTPLCEYRRRCDGVSRRFLEKVPGGTGNLHEQPQCTCHVCIVYTFMCTTCSICVHHTYVLHTVHIE